MAVKESTMGRSRGFLKALFGGLTFVGFVWLLLGGEILESGGTKTISMSAAHYSIENLEPMNLKDDRERLVIRRQLDLSYMSKRRVPNGPDPIHNREYVSVFSLYAGGLGTLDNLPVNTRAADIEKLREKEQKMRQAVWHPSV